MDNAEFYSLKNKMQRTEDEYVLKKYLKLLEWKSSDYVILDVGSGDGSVLNYVLAPRIQKFCKTIYAVDVSPEMVKFARKQYQEYIFDTMDISVKDLPLEYEEKFDKIFSFYCLHWVINQRQAFDNIYRMLRPGGSILMAFIANHPLYDIYRTMAKMPKWADYMKDYKNFIAPFHHSKNPEKELRHILKGAGFKVQICKIKKRFFTYPNLKSIRDAVAAVNPFLCRIPFEQHDEYFIDYFNELKKLKEQVFLEKSKNNSGEIFKYCYHLFIVVAHKANSKK